MGTGASKIRPRYTPNHVDVNGEAPTYELVKTLEKLEPLYAHGHWEEGDGAPR